jgi:alpha-galactosidase
MSKLIAGILPLSLLLAAQSAVARDHADPLQGPANGLAVAPPMGWNSWNKIGADVNEKVIRDAADAMVSSGMRDAGYRYIIIDDFW